MAAAVGADAGATAAVGADDGFAVAVVGGPPEVTALPGSESDDKIVDWLRKMIVQNSLAHLASSARSLASIAEPPPLMHHSVLQLQPRNVRFMQQVISKILMR